MGQWPKETQHRWGLALGERKAGFSPLTEVMGAVQQDDHAVHSEDPNGQQANRTHLEGKESEDSEPYTDHSHNWASPSLGARAPLIIKLPLGWRSLPECPCVPRQSSWNALLPTTSTDSPCLSSSALGSAF